jgi:hypothetical protein
MLRRLGLSVTESVYTARIGTDSPPDQYLTQNLKYQRLFLSQSLLKMY